MATSEAVLRNQDLVDYSGSYCQKLGKKIFATQQIFVNFVADPDSGASAFLTPGSGNNPDPGSGH
jgi:hypothetical protein